MKGTSALLAGIAAAAAMLMLTGTVQAHADEEVAVMDADTCDFTKQLQSLEARLAFISQVKEAKDASRSPYGEQATHSITFTDRYGESQEIDTLSFNCLSCHDGINARIHDIRYKNSRQSRSNSMDGVRGSHPIGMHYGSHAYASSEFKPLYQLNEEMVLADGKVGCLTCHNPLRPEKRHLVSKSLCLDCHKK
jgi:hypothetical protein